ncbi:MAG: hypothetical protein BGO09_05105 [Bacteroidetes bacterium 47-18]|nr:MAG: hypothetical protein BGO09_05105 [Bacteroidetes bacterium 47-18]
MKKILTSIALLSIGAFAANAQVTADLSIRITSPQANTKLKCDDDLTIQYALKNNGPDPIDLTGVDSTILVGIQGTMDSTYDNGGTPMVRFSPIGKFTLAVDQELTNQTRTRKVRDLFRVLEYPIQSNEYEVFRDNVRSGQFLVFVQTIGFGNGDANNMWQSAPNYDDPADSNDIKYVLVEFDCAQGVKEINANTSALNVYPNPAMSGVTNFEFEFKGNETATVRVYDVTGRTVLTQEVKGTGVQTVQVDVSSLNAGMYNMEIATADRRGVSKFTVAK